MNTKRPPHIALILLSTLLALPADAQVDIEASPMEFLPLEVGNQWTYEHSYRNWFFNFSTAFGIRDSYWAEPGSVKRAVVRALFGIPSHPYYDWEFMTNPHPLEDLDDLERYQQPSPKELTLEITHTEIIDGQEYFVFSDVPYDWPPVPNFFLAGQKVRFSEEGALLFRWNGQDIPFYVFQEDAYSYDSYYDAYTYITPEYPVLQSENLPVEHTIWSRFFSTLPYMYLEPPPSLSQAAAAIFGVTWKESPRRYFHFGTVGFVAGYGLVDYDRIEVGTGDTGFILPDFKNSILAISAVIGGQQLEFSYTPVEWTNIQPTTWGQLKARHRQRP